MMNDAMTNATGHNGRPVASDSSRLIMKFRYPCYGLPCALTTDRQQMRWWAIYSRILAYEIRHKSFHSMVEFNQLTAQLAHAFETAVRYRNYSRLCAR